MTMERGNKRNFDDTSTTKPKHIHFGEDEDNSKEDNQSSEPVTEEKDNDVVIELDKLNPVAKANARKRKQHQKFRTEHTKNTKRGRIIVRNLSFKTKEDSFKKHFEQFGPVSEVKLLKRPDGKLVGCGFVQFDVVQNAAKAIYNLSGKPFLGRDIVCDWALGKSTYVKNIEEAVKKEIKQEDDIVEIKEEPFDENATNPDLSVVKDEKDLEVKEEKSDNEESDDDDKPEIIENNIKEDEKSEESDSSEEDNDSESEQEDEIEEVIKEPEAKRPRVISNDVQEGKTIFIKNVPFSATNNDVKQCMQQFGPIYYALVCVDKLTEYSKGTAFVKFMNVEDAEKCLAAGTELTLMGNVLDCHKAMNKTDLDKKNAKPEVQRDSRHLYLVKEGVILAGTNPAQGVSATDMTKRLELERWKSQILRNLNMFVSLYRLIIHNLPPTYDDKQLRALFAKYAGPKAVIKEAKVMLNFRNIGPNGKPLSKEYGFVSFARHEDALKALRAINNNPSIFTRAKRPIVAFSIENKSVINAKTKRLMKSKINNPKCKEYDPTAKEEATKTNPTGNNVPVSEYSGVAAKPGLNKLRSKHKLANQAQIHFQQLKDEKRRMKLTRKSLKKKKIDYLKQAKQKKGKKKQEKTDNLSKIVNKYTKTTNKFKKSSKKQKWYES